MGPGLTFFAGLGLLVLFGWYFATDVGMRKRLLATTLVMLLVAFSIATIWPPREKIQLGLDIQGGTSFLIRLMGGDKEVNKGMLDQAVEVIRKRVDYFGGERSDSGSDSRPRHGENPGSARTTFAGSEARIPPCLSRQRRTFESN